jgi:hypothetical protein
MFSVVAPWQKCFPRKGRCRVPNEQSHLRPFAKGEYENDIFLEWLCSHEANDRPSGSEPPGSSLHPKYHSGSSPSPRFSTMASTSTSQRPKGHDSALSTLDVLIQVLTIAKDTCGIPPAQVAFGSAVALLTMIRVRFPYSVMTNS